MKRGFTLIEIMAVIVVLGSIGLIALTAVDKVIKDNNEKAYQVQISNIEDATRVWGANNLSYLPDNSGEVVSIPLIVLKRDGLVDKELSNPKTGETFPNDLYISISYREGIYQYNVVEDSGISSNNDLDVPIVILYDEVNKEINVGETLDVDGVVILRNGQKVNLSSGTYITVDTDINSSVPGDYSWSLIANDGKSFTMTRKITVK